VLICVLLISPADAKFKDTLDARRACQGDMVRFCLSAQPRGPKAIWQCLRAERKKLSPDCAAAVD